MEVLICTRKIRVYKWEPPEEIWDLLPLSKSIFLYIIIRYMTNKATICGVMRADVKRKWIISMSHSVLLSLSHSDLPSVTVFTWMKRHDFKLLIVQINLVESLWDKLVLVITFITAALNTRSLTSLFFFLCLECNDKKNAVPRNRKSQTLLSFYKALTLETPCIKC